MIALKETSLSQKTNYGHNIVAGENATVNVGSFIVTSLSSKDITAFTEMFFTCIRHREWAKATSYIDAVMSLESIEQDCKSLIELFRYKLDVSQSNCRLIKKDIFISLFRNEDLNPTLKDAIESIYITHLAISSAFEARNYYFENCGKGKLSNESFYEFVADETDLEKYLNSANNSLLLYEGELCGMARCALRNKNYVNAFILAKKLLDEYPSFNSKVIYTLSCAERIRNIIERKHYWLLDSHTTEQLNKIIEEFLELAKNSDDQRILTLAAVLLDATQFECKNILDYCVSNIEIVRKILPDFSRYIEDLNRNTCHISLNFDTENLLISENEFIRYVDGYFNGDLKNSHFIKWSEAGGRVESDSLIVNDLVSLFIYAILCDQDKKKNTSHLEDKLNEFLMQHGQYIDVLNVRVIYKFCLMLDRVELHNYIVKIIQPMLPDSPWISPVIDLYAKSLLELDKIQELDLLLNVLDGQDLTLGFLVTKAKRLIFTNQRDQAALLFRENIKNYGDIIYFWNVFFEIHLEIESELSKIDEYVKKIPKKIFDNFSPAGLQILYRLANSHIELSNYYILEWFIDDPVQMSIHMTNFHFYCLTLFDENNDDELLVKTLPSYRCSFAVDYSMDNKRYKKLIVDDCFSDEYKINSKSGLGNFLMNLEVGSSGVFNFSNVILHEILPAIVGAFHMSLHIRENINTGEDCFKSLTFDKDDIDGFVEKISFMSKPEKLHPNKIGDLVLPLLMKIKHSGEKELVKYAIKYLVDLDSNKYFGIHHEGNSSFNCVVLDILSITYLCITGLYDGLKNSGIKILITSETNEIIEIFLKDICSPNYMAIGHSDGGLTKTTAEDISNDYIINNLKSFSSYFEIIYPDPVDMHEDLSRMKDIVDISHYSSLRVCLSKNLPFLCFDVYFCQLYKSLNIDLINVRDFLIFIDRYSSSHKFTAIKSTVYFGLQVPIKLIDVVDLCKRDANKQFVASRFLLSNAIDITDQNELVEFLTSCLVNAIYSNYFRRSKGASYWESYYAESVVYSCCRVAITKIDHNSFESRLAVLIINVLSILSPYKDITYYCVGLFQKFIYGNFLSLEAIIEQLEIMTVSR